MAKNEHGNWALAIHSVICLVTSLVISQFYVVQEALIELTFDSVYEAFFFFFDY